MVVSKQLLSGVQPEIRNEGAVLGGVGVKPPAT